MLPIELDLDQVSSVHLPGDAGIKRVLNVLHAIVTRRVIPYFRTRLKADAIRLSRVAERYAISRFEDFGDVVRTVSFVSHAPDGWTIDIHERVFDYWAFVLPSDADAALGPANQEGRQALAFAELLLRHEIEHMIFPEHSERVIIRADADFAMDRRERDPTYYGTLCEALHDPYSGLRGEPYLDLFRRVADKQPVQELIDSMLANLSRNLAAIPLTALRAAFPGMDRELKRGIIAACVALAQANDAPLVERASYLRCMLALLYAQVRRDRSEAAALFRELETRVGIDALFAEIGIPSEALAARESDERFELLAERLRELSAQEEGIGTWLGEAATPSDRAAEPSKPAPRTLKDRIEAAKADPLVPRSVIETIDKNRASMTGHSAAKYSELAETLLAVPWGHMATITVSPDDFVRGLDISHYGLARPKEIIADFFSNLVWRYQRFAPGAVIEWQRSGSAYLFVGPPGVGKTSLAISIARNLNIPYHKVSLGGMRDESDLVGHGFTYEGSKPGAVVQGLIKMGVMNGMFILDEADKTEKFAIAPLLEILDPEQNHLFHDKYTQTTVDIDLSNCHFILTANTLETVPSPIVNRCQVVTLSRYSVDEKIAIARRHVLPRLLQQHGFDADEMALEAGHEDEHLRFLILNYTHEAGVRQLEQLLRTLLLRVHRKEILAGGVSQVFITRQSIKQHLDQPARPRTINDEDRVGEVLGLGVDVERGIGVIIPIQATRIAGGPAPLAGGALSMVHTTGNIEKVMDESRKVATTGILHCSKALGIDPDRAMEPVHLHLMGGSTRKDGPSAGSAIALALASFMTGERLRRDVAVSGEIDTQGRITAVGGLDIKLETAIGAGCKTVVVPAENLYGAGGIERFPQALQEELHVLGFSDWEHPHEPFDYRRQVLQVVAVDHIAQAYQVARIDQEELSRANQNWFRQAAESAPATSAQRDFCAAILVKEVSELDLTRIHALLDRHLTRCWLLVPPESLKAVRLACAQSPDTLTVHHFDPASEDFSTALQHLLSPSSAAHEDRDLVVIAPYFVLNPPETEKTKRPSWPGTRPPRFFANNFARQGVKLKGCKRCLNHAALEILDLGAATLEQCPFFAQHHGVIMADLDPIEEKYRLDLNRAERLLSDALDAWLAGLNQGH